MRFYEIKATKGEQIIIERYFENGDRFIKNIPFNPVVFVKIKEQFANKNVLVEMSSSHWIRISKTGENIELKAAAEKAIGKSEITREEIVNMEADMLKKAGFLVTVELKGDDGDTRDGKD